MQRPGHTGQASAQRCRAGTETADTGKHPHLIPHGPQRCRQIGNCGIDGHIAQHHHTDILPCPQILRRLSGQFCIHLTALLFVPCHQNVQIEQFFFIQLQKILRSAAKHFTNPLPGLSHCRQGYGMFPAGPGHRQHITAADTVSTIQGQISACPRPHTDPIKNTA